jgi:predicted nucleic acid-binding protein
VIVVDASVVVDYLLGASGPAGGELATALRAREPVIAPDLLDVEVAQVLRRFVLRGGMGAAHAASLVAELVALPITRHPPGLLVERAFELRDNLTVYDAVYLALAELADAPLLTGDGAFEDVPGAAAEVRVRATT